MIGIIVADPNEINQFPFEIKETKKVNQLQFTVFSNNIVAVHSGIGIINAAAATQELISTFKVKEIINYGAVGANDELNVYDIITPAKIFLHDAVTPWYKRGVTPGEKEFFTNALSSKMNHNLGSGSSFLTNKDEIMNLKSELDVHIFDMETAGIAQIADKNNVPLKVIKVVSDSIGVTETDLEDINTRINKAGKIAFDKMLEELKNTL